MKTRRLLAVALTVCTGIACLSLWMDGVMAQDQEPIAYIGHGAFFDRAGNQIAVTEAFVERAQAWYRQDMLPALNDAQRDSFAALEEQLLPDTQAQGQAKQVLRQRTLEWLDTNSPRRANDYRKRGKLRALAIALRSRVPARSAAGRAPLVPFTVPADVQRRLASVAALDGSLQPVSVTGNSGQAYLDECRAAKVPIPPPIGVMDTDGLKGWKSQGFIPPKDQFIVGTPAEVRTYKSVSPPGMCYALPRYSDATLKTVDLDGVICLSQETAKVCFWDNQIKGSGFQFSAGEKIPIGVPDLNLNPSGNYQAGGAELETGSGGVCTECHAGENPYITHPKSNLGNGVLWETLRTTQGLPTFAIARFDPIVATSWPQNQQSQSGVTAPIECRGCHSKSGAGRFPHLSNELPGYCGTILTQAITRTMAPSNPGGAAAAATAFRDKYCLAPSDPSAGDPKP
jgi:hypothetical protein